MPAASCGPFAGQPSPLVPGSYYEALPRDATPLLARVVRSTGRSVQQVPIHQTFGGGIAIAAGDCLVSLGKRTAGSEGGINSELQVFGLIGPP